MADLTNHVDISGQYGEESSPISFSSNTVSTTIIEGLTVTKAADKVNWVDGPLTYTVIIKNSSGGTLTNGVLTDNLDTTLVVFNSAYGVQINGVSSSEYTYNDGELKITLPELATNSTTIILFQVTKKT